MAISKKWVEQFDRVKRYYERFKQINEGEGTSRNSAYYEDDVYSFFINCYHLKDWIENDPAVAIKKQEVENYINTNPALQICADMCNGAKHLSRVPSQIRSGKPRSIDYKAYSLSLGAGPAQLRIKFFVDDQDAFKIATECMQKWEDFIKNHSI